MDETSIIAVLVALHHHETVTDSWCPIDTGLSRVDIYFSPTYNAYRIIGVDEKTNQYTLHAAVFIGLIYQRVSDTFHQCIHVEEVDGQFVTTSFGLNFRNAQEAQHFGEKMDFCYEKLAEGYCDPDTVESATVPVEANMTGVISELHDRNQPVSKISHSSANDPLVHDTNTSKFTRKVDRAAGSDTKTRESDREVGIHEDISEQPMVDIRISGEISRERSRETSKDTLPKPLVIQIPRDMNKSKGIPSTVRPISREELETLKVELFSYIDQWKVDIITAINQKKEREKVPLVQKLDTQTIVDQ